jgi:hypothetical protein
MAIDRLLEIMQGTTATPEQVEEAVRINTESRLRALKIGLLIMAGVALVSIIRRAACPTTSPARSCRPFSRAGERRRPRDEVGRAAWPAPSRAGIMNETRRSRCHHVAA